MSITSRDNHKVIHFYDYRNMTDEFVREIVVGIGEHTAGFMVKKADDTVVARISKSVVIWDGYIGMVDNVPSNAHVRDAIHGQNDTDEAGYIVAILSDYFEIPLTTREVEALSVGDNSIMLTTYRSGSWEMTTEDDWYSPTDESRWVSVGSMSELRGWEYPERDQ